ncbi:uncharacterized protein LOC116348135 isoform X1 [Contarinia nasturtii]|uniref:uncharacterized protein LOC116348135 isoform X1 n=1 Tax=Contarinia nasturtii TaxID=265458 RepID=UPI0012D4A4A0|nr:uncharacterized protein LOC116348135 isoform X1 [Contarinia nasturtii]
MNAETSFELRIPVNIEQLDGYTSPEFIFKQFSWRAETEKMHFSNNVTTLGIFLRCNITEPGPSDFSCIVSASMCLRSSRSSIEKSVYFMHFSPTCNKHGYPQFILWTDLMESFVTGRSITIHMKIRAIALSMPKYTVDVTTLSTYGNNDSEKPLKVRAFFKEIYKTLGAISSDIHFHGSIFKICIFKRPYENVEHFCEDTLWLYLLFQPGEGQSYKTLKWSYSFRLLTQNDTLGALSTKVRNVKFSTLTNSHGAPFISLNELFYSKNMYISDGGIIIEMDIRAIKDTQTSAINIKNKPQSSKHNRIKLEPLEPQLNTVSIRQRSDDRKTNEPLTEIDTDFVHEPENVLQLNNCSPSTSSTLLDSRLPNNKRSVAVIKPELNCTLCAVNLIETETYTTKCGHLYCMNCMNNDVSTRGMCIKCNKHVSKFRCIQVYFNDEQRIKKRRCVDTRASKLLRSFLEKTDQNPSNELELNCPLCAKSLFDVNTFTTCCGHMYCRECLYGDIGQRKMCIVCNRVDNQKYWTEIFFS